MEAELDHELIHRVRSWMSNDIDPKDRSDLAKLLDIYCSGGPDAEAAQLELNGRFSGPLCFGTAGLRGAYEAGESRMNRATVVRTSAGLADYILATVSDAKKRGIVLARDARHGSEQFQLDVAAVFAARGLVVWWLPETVPTPVVPFAVRRLKAAVGVMITASHNPGTDNGYKVYAEHGAQIAPPVDEAISRAIQAQPGAIQIERIGAFEHPLIRSRPDLLDAYVDTVAAGGVVAHAPVDTVDIVYTAMHGVGGEVFLKACQKRGVKKLHPVAAQLEPDPSFSTVAFPNPEEPEALNLALAEADAREAELILAHDPDADRLAAVVKCPRRGGWRRLSGNDIGVLLAHHLLTYSRPGDPKRGVVTTVVSSRLLERMAADFGVVYRETFTGFKYIAEAMRGFDAQGIWPLFGYEEALGYAVNQAIRDKDGIASGLVLVEAAALAKQEGQTLLDRLDGIFQTHGVFVSHQRSVLLSGLDANNRREAGVHKLRFATDQELAALGVIQVHDFYDGRVRSVGQEGKTDQSLSAQSERLVPNSALPTGLLVYKVVQNCRVAVRPSGTEPKMKFYLEAEVTWEPGSSFDDLVRQTEHMLRELAHRFVTFVGLGSQ